MTMKQVTIRVTTTGSAGSASGSGVSGEVVRGEILGIYIDYHASAPGTTDVTVRTTTAPTHNILAVTDTNTDGFYAPAASPVTAANAAITNAHRPFPVHDTVTVSVAQCDALTDAVVVRVLYR